MVPDYCRNCGAKLADDARFCSSCGDAVDDSTAEAWGEAGTVTTTEPTGTVDTGTEPIAQSTPATTARQHTTETDTAFAALTHLLALFTWVIGPAVVLVATDDPFVEANARNALNWQITFSIYMLVSFVLVFAIVGILFLLLVPILDLIFCVVAAIKANDGEAWNYPITLDLF